MCCHSLIVSSLFIMQSSTAQFSPAVIPANPPHPDRLDRLGVEDAHVLGIHQDQVLLIQIHIQVFALKKSNGSQPSLRCYQY